MYLCYLINIVFYYFIFLIEEFLFKGPACLAFFNKKKAESAQLFYLNLSNFASSFLVFVSRVATLCYIAP